MLPYTHQKTDVLSNDKQEPQLHQKCWNLCSQKLIHVTDLMPKILMQVHDGVWDKPDKNPDLSRDIKYGRKPCHSICRSSLYHHQHHRWPPTAECHREDKYWILCWMRRRLGHKRRALVSASVVPSRRRSRPHSAHTRLLQQHVNAPMYSTVTSTARNDQKYLLTNYHHNRYTALFRDHPGELVPAPSIPSWLNLHCVHEKTPPKHV